jgi:hypothetical protein
MRDVAPVRNARHSSSLGLLFDLSPRIFIFLLFFGEQFHDAL